MKVQLILTCTLCAFLTACNRTQTNSSSTATVAVSERAATNYEEQLKRQAILQDAYDARVKRSETLLTAQEEIMKQQAAAFVRYEKILSTWEIQQQQYQKYLDSLSK